MHVNFVIFYPYSSKMTPKEGMENPLRWSGSMVRLVDFKSLVNYDISVRIDDFAAPDKE